MSTLMSGVISGRPEHRAIRTRIDTRGDTSLALVHGQVHPGEVALAADCFRSLILKPSSMSSVRLVPSRAARAFAFFNRTSSRSSVVFILVDVYRFLYESRAMSRVRQSLELAATSHGTSAPAHSNSITPELAMTQARSFTRAREVTMCVVGGRSRGTMS